MTSPSPTDLQVLASRNDRLGARLRNMTAAWEFARKLDCRLILHWDNFAVYNDGSYHFFDFFDEAALDVADGEVTFEFGPQDEVYARYGLGDGIRIANYRHKPAEYFAAHPRLYWFNMTAPYTFAEPSELNRAALQREIFLALPLNAAVADCVDQVAGEIDLRKAVAVHVRRGDILTALSGLSPDYQSEVIRQRYNSAIVNFMGRYAPLEAYYAAIDRLAGDRKLVLFSDDPGFLERIAQRYPGRIVDPHAPLDRFALTPAQRAFAEMLLISKTERLICSTSAFPDFAALVGRCKKFHITGFVNGRDVLAELDGLIATHPGRTYILAELGRHYAVYFRKRKLPAQAQFFEALEKKMRNRLNLS